MSMDNGDKKLGAQTGDASRTPPVECAAEDLKTLLAEIAGQITQSEQRQSVALEQMLGRIDALADATRRQRAKVPAEFLPAFERIEDGVADLARRISETRDAHATYVVTDTGAPAQVQRAVSPGGMAPANSAGTREKTAAVTPTDAVIPFDDEAWDRAAADALYRHYESGNAGYSGALPDRQGDADEHETNTWDPVASARVDAIARGMSVETGWLDQRFADIARLIENQATRIEPDRALHGLGQRFDSLEQRFSSALDAVATRSDVEGLGGLELHIADLARQFDETRQQLERLDNIEQTLAAVVDRLTDPRFDEILNRGGQSEADLEPMISAAVEQIASRLKDGRDAGGTDLAELADAAAERVATRFADLGQASDSGSAEDMNAVRQLLEQFINERREGDETTAAMLDTMQQAMIRVLDRVDAIEQSSARSAPQEYVREQVRFGTESAAAATSGAQRAAEAADAFAQHVRQRPDTTSHAQEPTSHEGAEDDLAPRPFAAAPAAALHAASASSRPAPKPQLAAAGGATIERLRQDFIADAQRAKAKATASVVAPTAPPQATADEPRRTRVPVAEAPVVGVTLRSPRAPEITEAAPAAKSPRGKGAGGRMPSRKLLVSALVLLVAIPGLMILMQKRSARPTAMPDAAQIEMPARPGDTPAKAGPTAAEMGAQMPASGALLQDAAHSGPQPEGATQQPGAAPQGSPATTEAAPADAPKSGAAPQPQSSAPAASPTLASTDGVPLGIAVANPARKPTLDQLARLQQRQSMAELSSRLGAAQVGATPAALIPEFMYQDAQARAAGQTDTVDSSTAAAAPVVQSPLLATKRALDLPPATLGPLSLRMAAAKGDPSAQFEIGARLAEGKGTRQNFEQAADWYKKSATQGFVQSQYRLATLYERGLGLKQDINRAKVWYKRAAEGGNVKAMHNLAVLSAGRAAKTPDYATAGTFFTMAAERGLADSQFNLAVLYEGGLGVAKSMKTAYMWYAVAAKAGDQEAAKRQGELEGVMAAGELEAARNAAAGFRAKTTDRLANDAIVAGEDWKTRARASGEI
ncbi:MAG: hypothetical protein AB7E80_14075 [Hyphomicrobiaceae bacterium]